MSFKYVAVWVQVSQSLDKTTFHLTSAYENIGELFRDYIKPMNKLSEIKKKLEIGEIVPFSPTNYYIFSQDSLDKDIQHVQEEYKEKKLFSSTFTFCIFLIKFLKDGELTTVLRPKSENVLHTLTLVQSQGGISLESSIEGARHLFISPKEYGVKEIDGNIFLVDQVHEDTSHLSIYVLRE